MYRYVGGLGVRWDPATGLYYMRQRWYDPSLQRFISRDLLRSTNRYSYAKNSPTNYIDPTGMAPSPTLTQQQIDLIDAAIQQIWNVNPAAAAELKGLLDTGRIDNVLDTGRGLTTFGALGLNPTIHLNPKTVLFNQGKSVQKGLCLNNPFYISTLIASTLIHELTHFHHGAAKEIKLWNDNDRDTYRAEYNYLTTLKNSGNLTPTQLQYLQIVMDIAADESNEKYHQFPPAPPQ